MELYDPTADQQAAALTVVQVILRQSLTYPLVACSSTLLECLVDLTQQLLFLLKPIGVQSPQLLTGATNSTFSIRNRKRAKFRMAEPTVPRFQDLLKSRVS